MSKDKKPVQRDGIAEILASGRAPGFFVRGQARDTLYIPTPAGMTPRHAERSCDKIFEQRKKIARMAKKQQRKSRSTGLRMTGAIPIVVDNTLREKYGDDYQGEEKTAIQKRHGFDMGVD